MTPEELDAKINAENGWPGEVGYVEPRIAKLVAASLLERDGQRSRRDEAARAKRRKALYPAHAEHQPKRKRAR